MSRRLILEEFDGTPTAADFGEPFGGLPPLDSEEALPEGDFALPDMPMDGPPADGEEYERGYRAGWDDCEAKAQEERTAVGAELARNMQELGFTFHEARAHILSGIEPLLTSILGKVLPRVVTATLGQSIVEELSSLVEAASDAPVTILVSPASFDLVEAFLAEATALPHRLVAEETLSEWQVFFRLGDHERQLDLGDVVDRIVARLSAFADQNDRELKHG